jgi:FkbM family methyltransferase
MRDYWNHPIDLNPYRIWNARYEGMSEQEFLDRQRLAGFLMLDPFPDDESHLWEPVIIARVRVFVRSDTLQNAEYRCGDILVADEAFRRDIYGLRSLRGDVTSVIDLGANIGTFTMAVKHHWPNCNVLAVEPSTENFVGLRLNTLGLEGVTLIQAAVVGSTEHHAITFHGSGVGASISPWKRDVDTEQVSTKLASDMITGPIDLLKIDIEGAEIEAFRDLKDNNRLAGIETIIGEWHGDNFGQIVELLSPTHQLSGDANKSFKATRR